MPPLGEWERYHGENQPDDARSFACFRNQKTGKKLNSDPRLIANALRKSAL